MSGLFGYIGEEDPILLEKMADILAHRHAKSGYKAYKLPLSTGRVLEFAIIQTGPSFYKQAIDSTIAASGIFINSSPQIEKLNLPQDFIKYDGAYVGLILKGKDFYLWRDPAGVKVIYYAQNNRRLLFSSEVKALFADKQLEKKLRLSALPEYFTYSYIPGEKTMFEGVYELEAGCYLALTDNKKPIQKRYFFPEWQENLYAKGNINVLKKELENLIISNIQSFSQQINETPGVFLSGGIDSSSILALAEKAGLQEMHTFSAHFGKKYVSENEFIDLMLSRYKTKHHYLEIKPSLFIKKLSDIIYYLDEPIGDPVTVPNFLLSEYASAYVPAILNGEGGDPCFGGPKNIPMLLFELYNTGDNNQKKAEAYLHSYQRAYANLKELFTHEFLQETGGENQLLATIDPFFQLEKPREFINQLMWINIRRKGANLILPKVDKMSSANSLFAYPPLFLGNIIAYSLRIPPSYKLRGNIEKWILKEICKDIVPKEILLRPKSGMRVPVRFWFQKEMKHYAKKILTRDRIQKIGIFNYEYIQKLLAYKDDYDHASRYGLKLWMLMTLFLWQERVFSLE